MTQTSSNWNTWLLAIRPRTLPAAAAGVIMGSALAWRDGYFRWDAFLVCLLVALLLQIGSNLANDVFDFERGTDTAERMGPTRVTQAGLLTPSQVKYGMAVVFGLAGLLGLYLAWIGGPVIIVMGAAAILSAIAYTGGPFPLGHYGLGDVFVFLFFGIAAVAGTYYIQARFVSAAAWWMTIPPGLIRRHVGARCWPQRASPRGWSRASAFSSGASTARAAWNRVRPRAGARPCWCCSWPGSY